MIKPTIELELALLKKYQTVIAIDEVGRGPWAGPLVFGLIKLEQDFITNKEQQELLTQVRDSKMLSPKKRQELAVKIQQIFWGRIISLDNHEIDKRGVQAAQRQGVAKIVAELGSSQTFFLLDLMRGVSLEVPHQMVVKGDSKHAGISAASIIAKVYRDNWMIDLHQKDPRYGFDQHKGYGTKLHQERLAEHGPSIWHRASFRPIARLFKGQKIV
ncbi:MAG: ribonuclease HII [Candidatus Komeilibacteria bacterium]|nr:ribonuclease HII [Candidatus Komeilibacteria bacterium]